MMKDDKNLQDREVEKFQMDREERLQKTGRQPNRSGEFLHSKGIQN